MTVPYTFADQSGNVPAAQLDANFAAVDFRSGLTSNTTFYVRTDGNDSNTGLANTAGGAWLTLQGAINNLKLGIDFCGYRVTLQIADGTYSGSCLITGPFVGEGSSDMFTIQGNTADPASVSVTNAGNVFRILAARVALKGMSASTTGSGIGLQVGEHAYIEVSDYDFGPAAEERCLVGTQSYLVATGPLSVTGAALSWLHITSGAFANLSNQTITYVSNPTNTTYVIGIRDASAAFQGSTIVGTTTGRTVCHLDATLDLANLTGKLFGSDFSPQIEGYGKVFYSPAQDIIYVSATGSDNNDGYTAADDRAFATIAAAMEWLQARAYDVNNSRTPTIKVGPGTWTTPVALVDIPNADLVFLEGDITTPTNVVISTTSANCITAASLQTNWHVRGFELLTTTGGDCLVATRNCQIVFTRINFGACAGSHITISNGAIVDGGNSYTISGGAARHVNLDRQGIAIIDGGTVTISGTPAFSDAFAKVFGGSYARLSPTWSGSATGARYDIRSNAVIDANGAGTSSLPGNVGGSTATGGQYV